MADVTINELPSRGTVLGSDLLALSDTSNTQTYKATVAQVSIPSGVIVMWSGALANIPSGWNLCNGLNGTPDLRDRFIVGAGGQYSVTNTGGLSAVTLTTSQMPAHSHTYTSTPINYQKAAGSSPIYIPTGGQPSSSTSTVGGGLSHENRPPYYALAYIMKA